MCVGGGGGGIRRALNINKFRHSHGAQYLQSVKVIFDLWSSISLVVHCFCEF